MARIKLHKQARRRIERLITDRALQPGSQLPTETNLASELYVSRTTIRNALKLLEQEGKIERTPGQGTIVRQQHMG
jgi:DNA-binding GntR family transcriptional regulator